MAKARMNPILSELHGSLGKDLYFRQTRNGRTIISAKPDFSNRQFSEGQLDHQSRMQQAAAYAKAASKENPIYAKIAAGKAKNAYNVAVGDWFNPPLIQRIESNYRNIRVSAHDDVMVTRVTVSILDDEGNSLERGEAELQLGIWWVYDAANQGRIHVEAWDMAGNVTRQEFCPQYPFFSVWESPMRARKLTE